jgi:hypothetical protein
VTRTYMTLECSICGGNTSHSGQAASAHNHSKRHIEALEDKIAKGQVGYEPRVAQLKRENQQRKETRERRKALAQQKESHTS